MAEKNSTAKRTRKPAAPKPTADAAPEKPVEKNVERIQVIVPEEKMVRILYMDAVSADNQIPLGNGRIITGPGRIFSVSLNEFMGTFLTPLVSLLLRKRKLIVLSGLTDEQREEYGVKYASGEILESTNLFDHLIGCPTEEAAGIFRALCNSHRDMVAARIIEAYENGDNRIDRGKIEALNEISKEQYKGTADEHGAFTRILEDLNKQSL